MLKVTNLRTGEVTLSARTPTSDDIQKRMSALREREESSDKILFWSDEHRPEDYVGCIEDVDTTVLDRVLSALKEGKTHQQYRGWADCRICGEHLGSQDLYSEGFLWPSQAEHYIEEHGVWTPGLDRFAQSLLQSEAVVEEREANKDGSTSCGVFIPLPYDLAKDFPDKAQYDDSVPHFTVLYAGNLSPEDYKKFCKAVCRVARRLKPFNLELSGYGEFLNGQGQKIPHMKPGLASSLRLAMLHGLLRREVEKEVKIEHSYGGKLQKNVPYEAQFKAHATLNYMHPMVPYRGPKPTGSWRVTELEVWGHEKHRIPLGKTTALEPLGLSRDPLAIDYPMAVPEPVKPKTDMHKLTRSGDRIKVEGTLTVDEVRRRAHEEMRRTGLTANELLRRHILHQEAKDKLSGGKADDAMPVEFDQKELATGVMHELEHTDDPHIAREIAMDHLKEDPKYYSKLQKMEKQFEHTLSDAVGFPFMDFANALLRQPLAVESETSLKGSETHSGVGGSSGDVPADGTLPYFEQKKKIEKLKRQKLAGL